MGARILTYLAGRSKGIKTTWGLNPWLCSRQGPRHW